MGRLGLVALTVGAVALTAAGTVAAVPNTAPAPAASAPSTTTVDPDSPWPTMRHDLRNTAASPLVGTDPGGQPWSFRTGKGIFATPVIGADGTIYIGSADHTLYGLTPAGKPAWRFTTDGIIDTAPALLAPERGVGRSLATVAGGLEWDTWVAGAPMLVTLAVIGTVSALARRSPLPPVAGSLSAAGGAAVAALLLTLASTVTTETSNAAGTVTVWEGLTLLWTGGNRPGTVLGAALLVGMTWWINTAGLVWWRGGAALVKGLLIWPGLVLTLVVAAALVYLTSSPALGIAAVVLFPLAGLAVLMGLAGVPVSAGITRLSPEPYELWTWSTLLYGVAGLLAVVVLAVVVGLVLRARGHAGTWLDGVTVTAMTAGFLAWATDAIVAVPTSLGGPTRLAVNPLAGAAVGAVLAAIALLVRGRR